MRRSVTLFLHLLVHILFAILIFGIIRAAASLLWDFTDWIVSHGAPIFIGAIFYLPSVFLVATDIICLAFFLSVEAWIFSREVWPDSERGTNNHG